MTDAAPISTVVGRRDSTPLRTTLFAVLRDKMFRLGRDEDGAALVVTLAIFFLMYLGCMGVYAISMAVKDRIHLQNACDAAAYSAAVVQADTLSRIATINRAMSWTYVQMTRRQMDYIVYRWLEETCKHHRDDRLRAAAFAIQKHKTTTCIPMCPLCILPPLGWSSGLLEGSDDITLHGKDGTHGEYSERRLENEYKNKLKNSMNNSAASFYSASPSLPGLKQQIEDDLAAIKEMNEANEDLAKNLAGRVDDAVENILDSNVSQFMRKAGCFYYVMRHQNPLEYDSTMGTPRYLQTLDNSSDGEKRFVAFSDQSYLNHFRSGGTVHDEKVFGKGTDDWFVRGDERPELLAEGAEKGIHRSYNHIRSLGRNDGGYLYSSWEWFATGWTCGIIYGIHWMLPNSHLADESDLSRCPHTLHDVQRCYCKKGESSSSSECTTDSEIWHKGRFRGLRKATQLISKSITARCYADNNACYDDCYRGHRGGKAVYARPLVLNEDYFGDAGTITVGLACRNENVWGRILSSADGLFSAFDPSVRYSWAFAAAKAGYRYRDGFDGETEYKVDWKSGAWHSRNQSWNLCQSDLDAVFVPVRKGLCKAKDGRWNDGDDTILEKMVAAASEWKSIGAGAAVSNWDQVDAPGGVLIGNGHDGTLKWRELSHVMFH